MRVIILGGSGFIGRALTQALISRGDEVGVPTRHVPAATPSTGPEYQLWDGQDHSSLSQLLNGADAVINLLGENIAAKRWSSAQKERIISSRLLAGQALVIALQMPIVKPKVLIQASAIGYYGFWPENASAPDCTETVPPVQVFWRPPPSNGSVQHSRRSIWDSAGASSGQRPCWDWVEVCLPSCSRCFSLGLEGRWGQEGSRSLGFILTMK